MKNNQSSSSLSEGELGFKMWLIFDSYLICATTHPSYFNTSWQPEAPGLHSPIPCQTAAGWLSAEGCKELRKTRGHQ